MKRPEKIQLRQERDFSEVFETAFALLRSQPGTFFKGLVIYVGPFIVLSYALSLALFGYGIVTGFNDGLMGLAGTWVANLFGTVALIAYVAQFVAAYYHSPDGVVHLRTLWKPIRRRFLGYLWIATVFYLLSGIGFFFLLIGAAFFAAGLSSSPFAYAMEGETAGASIPRSFSLAGADYWTSFGLTLFLGIIWVIWAWIYSAGAFQLLESLTGIFTDDLSRDGNRLMQLVVSILTSLYSNAWLAICLLVNGVQYFNLTERMEFVNLKERISTVGMHLKTKPVDEKPSKLVI